MMDEIDSSSGHRVEGTNEPARCFMATSLDKQTKDMLIKRQ